MEDNKKPGQRDISDLKARLGLKKTGVMQAVSPTGQPAPTPAGNAVPAPPAPQGATAIPPPFGQPAPQQQPPPEPAPPPDPRRDPFAQQQAANLAAFYGVGQVLPGSTEGVSSAPISKPKPWGMIGAIAAVAAVGLGVGGACGAVYKDRVEFNRTIDQATTIRNEVERMAKQTSQIQDLIAGSADTKAGKPDFKLAKDLGELDLKKPDTQKLFRTNYAKLEDVAVDRLMNYYNDTIKLYDLIPVHAKKSEADKTGIEAFLANSGGGNAQKLYGVVADNSAAVPIAKFIEIAGPPGCPKTKPECKPNEWVYQIRAEPGANFSERAAKGKDSVMPIDKQSALYKSVLNGNPDALAVRAYSMRLAEIGELLRNLSAKQKEVVGDMKRSAERPKVFTF